MIWNLLQGVGLCIAAGFAWTILASVFTRSHNKNKFGELMYPEDDSRKDGK